MRTVPALTVGLAGVSLNSVSWTLSADPPPPPPPAAAVLQPGQSDTLKVKLNKPGSYEWYCPIDNHKQMGMKGEITVGAGGASKSSSDDSSGGGSGY